MEFDNPSTRVFLWGKEEHQDILQFQSCCNSVESYGHVTRVNLDTDDQSLQAIQTVRMFLDFCVNGDPLRPCDTRKEYTDLDDKEKKLVWQKKVNDTAEKIMNTIQQYNFNKPLSFFLVLPYREVPNWLTLLAGLQTLSSLEIIYTCSDESSTWSDKLSDLPQLHELRITVNKDDHGLFDLGSEHLDQVDSVVSKSSKIEVFVLELNDWHLQLDTVKRLIRIVEKWQTKGIKVKISLSRLVFDSEAAYNTLDKAGLCISYEQCEHQIKTHTPDGTPQEHWIPIEDIFDTSETFVTTD